MTNNTDRENELQQRIEQDKRTLDTLAMGARTQELLTKAVLIGGSVVLGYLFVRQLTGGKKSGLFRTLLMTAGSFIATEEGRKLLTAGKEKLTQLISKD